MKNTCLFRSLMFVPGHKKDLLEKSLKTNADVLLLDIEDSVQPKNNKKKARQLITEMLDSGCFSGRHVYPRINDRESGELLKDVLHLMHPDIDGFMYPKAKTAEDIYFFDKLLETVEYEKGYEIGTFGIIPLIETSSAVLCVKEICQASSRVIAVAFGSEDFISDLQGIHDINHQSLYTPRAMIAIGARAAGVIPIDTVHIRVHDLEDLESNLKQVKQLGYGGALVLNPKELPLVHRYFSPTIEEVENAQQLLKSAEKAKESNNGVAIINGQFIGPPIIKKAKIILERHRIIKGEI